MKKKTKKLLNAGLILAQGHCGGIKCTECCINPPSKTVGCTKLERKAKAYILKHTRVETYTSCWKGFTAKFLELNGKLSEACTFKYDPNRVEVKFKVGLWVIWRDCSEDQLLIVTDAADSPHPTAMILHERGSIKVAKHM